MATFLCQAHSLECLYLESGTSIGPSIGPGCHVDRLLSQCRLPNLRALIVEGDTITDTDFLSTFRGLPELKHLVLENVRMKRSHWRVVIDGIKSSLDLTSLHMNLLYCERWQGGSDVYIGGDDVDNFLHSRGPHPFSATATAFCTKDQRRSTAMLRVILDGEVFEHHLHTQAENSDDDLLDYMEAEEPTQKA